MINIRNFGSKVGVGVKYKHGIYAELCLKLWLESDWYFCDITGCFLKRPFQRDPGTDIFQWILCNF